MTKQQIIELLEESYVDNYNEIVAIKKFYGKTVKTMPGMKEIYDEGLTEKGAIVDEIFRILTEINETEDWVEYARLKKKYNLVEI